MRYMLFHIYINIWSSFSHRRWRDESWRSRYAAPFVRALIPFEKKRKKRNTKKKTSAWGFKMFYVSSTLFYVTNVNEKKKRFSCLSFHRRLWKKGEKTFIGDAKYSAEIAMKIVHIELRISRFGKLARERNVRVLCYDLLPRYSRALQAFELFGLSTDEKVSKVSIGTRVSKKYWLLNEIKSRDLTFFRKKKFR